MSLCRAGQSCSLFFGGALPVIILFMYTHLTYFANSSCKSLFLTGMVAIYTQVTFMFFSSQKYWRKCCFVAALIIGVVSTGLSGFLFYLAFLSDIASPDCTVGGIANYVFLALSFALACFILLRPFVRCLIFRTKGFTFGTNRELVFLQILLLTSWLDFVTDLNYIITSQFYNLILYILAYVFLALQGIIFWVLWIQKYICVQSMIRLESTLNLDATEVGNDDKSLEEEYALLVRKQYASPHFCMLAGFGLAISPALMQLVSILKTPLWDANDKSRRAMRRMNEHILLQALCESFPQAIVFTVNSIMTGQDFSSLVFSFLTSLFMVFVAIWPFFYACRKGVKMSVAFDAPHPGVFDAEGTVWDSHKDYLLHQD